MPLSFNCLPLIDLSSEASGGKYQLQECSLAFELLPWVSAENQWANHWEDGEENYGVAGVE